MKCALAAVGFIDGDIKHNVAVVASALKKCAGRADVIIFGEAFLQGFYGINFEIEHDKAVSVSCESGVIDEIRAMAKEHAVGVSFGFIENDGDAFYSSQMTVDKDGQKRTPVMIHRACFGSLERFIAIITENFAGAYPTWLTPVQVALLPVNNEFHLEYAKELEAMMENAHLRVKLDDRQEKLGYRLREAQMMKIPYTLVLGDQEKENHTVTYRKYGEKEQITVSIEDFLKMIHEEIDSKALLVK